MNLLNNSIRWRSSAEEFFLYNTLKISSSINEVGGFNISSLICFIIAWIVTYFCIFKGIKSSGKIIYFTATCPYIMLTVLIIQGATLPGSWKGLKFYLIPRWSTLLGIKVWVTAATQIFYSLGPAWGGLISMASFNKFNTDVLKLGMVIPLICSLTSFYAGIAIFSIIGNMANIINIDDITEVIESGPGLAFVAYPQALSLLRGSSLWSIMFFLTLWSMGVDSMFATLETIIQGISDEVLFITGRVKYIFTVSCCFALLLLGLPFTTRAGGYIFQIVDWYSTPISVLIIAIIESFAISYFYNYETLINQIEMMINRNIPKVLYWWFITCLCFLTPLSLFIIFINLIIGFSRPIFDKNQEYPYWTVVFGWSLAIFIILPIPIIGILQIIKNRKDIKSVFRHNMIFKELIAYRLREVSTSSA